MYTLFNNIRKYNIKPKLSLQLFDSFVSPILSYGSETWGITKSKELERIQLNFCKLILGIKITSSNAAVYGELSRYTLYINRFIKVIKYWFKLLHSENKFLKALYSDMLHDVVNGNVNWLTNVKFLLDRHGFSYVWDSPYIINQKHFVYVFKQCLIDSFIQEWRADIQKNKVLSLYHNIKHIFSMESYLVNINDFRLRSALTKLRISAHTLRIETGRYSRPPLDRNERKCQLCNSNDIEDEFHFIFICNTFDHLRQLYFKRYYRTRPSMAKFIDLLQSENKTNILNLCKFIIKANALRKHSIALIH
jgi:hypothetical protein